MARCDACGKEENMPYHCRHCGGTFCGDHRLPENHDCPGLEEWNDPDGVFDSGFDDSVTTGGNTGGREASASVSDRLGISTGPGSVLAYFRGNMTYVFLAVMWITLVLQYVVTAFLGNAAHQALFVLHPNNPEYVWTWVTSIFAHSRLGLFHIVGNSIVIFFFGRLVEDYVGSRDFTVMFLASGVVAGLGQLALMIFQGSGSGALGASGAALAILGTLTVLNRNLTVYLWFLIPIPIYIITGVYAFASMAGIFGIPSPLGGEGIADGAHFLGLMIGVWYGYRVKDRMRVPDSLQFGGGGGGRRGPGGPGGPGGRGPF